MGTYRIFGFQINSRLPLFWLKISGGPGFFGSADDANQLKVSSVSPESDSGDTELVFNTFAASAEPKNPGPPEIFNQIAKFSAKFLDTWSKKSAHPKKVG